MHQSLVSFIFDETLLLVKGRYEVDGEEESFKTGDATLKKGDFVVVDSPARHGFSVVEISQVGLEPDLDSQEDVRWIVSKVNAAALDKIKARDKELIEAHNQSKLRAQRKRITRRKPTASRPYAVFSCSRCGVQPGQQHMDRGGNPAADERESHDAEG